MTKRKNLYNVIPLDRNLAKRVIHEAENDRNEGVSSNGLYYTPYSDGVKNDALGRETMTIGDGVAETSDAPKHWFSGKPILAKELDDWTYNKLVEGDAAIRAAYDDKYGTPGDPNPSSRLGMKPRLGAAQVRYQQYRLGKNTDIVLDALHHGNDTYLGTALYIAGKQNNGGRSRIKRVEKVFGNSYYR